MYHFSALFSIICLLLCSFLPGEVHPVDYASTVETEPARQPLPDEINFYPKPVFELGMLGVLQQEKYRGKVILVDIWGTWCGPCLAQFPHMEKVKAALADEDIQYVYFANEHVNPSIEKWQRVARSFKLTGDHYLTGKEQVFQLMKNIGRYQPSFSYPTYMIVNGRGEIVDHDAPHPGDGDELVRKIKKVLAENAHPTVLPEEVPPVVMDSIYREIQTPHKYGIVLKHPDSTKMVDSPTVFRRNGQWYMSYIVFDGQGYETWLARSNDLLRWETLGKLLSFTENTWDANQKAGYMALVDIDWGGTYEMTQHNDKYWLSYLGGATEGYEEGMLGVGMARQDPLSIAEKWIPLAEPVLLPDTPDARWFETDKIYKSTVIRDRRKLTGYPFLMYYNAKGDTATYESIGLAGSADMIHWERIGADPLITRRAGICGDAQIVKMGDLYVMFYFGAFWKPGAFERFACSYDLVHWTDWQGPDLIAPSEDYDQQYAHKPWVVKWKGIVYHFYNAVGSEGRVIALATSAPMPREETSE